jgi:hypothetical protein
MRKPGTLFIAETKEGDCWDWIIWLLNTAAEDVNRNSGCLLK